MNLNDLNNIDELSDLKIDYMNNEKNNKDKDIFLNSSEGNQNGKTNLYIIQKLSELNKENDIIKKDNIIYKIIDKKVYNYDNLHIGKIYNKLIKFLNKTEEENHNKLKQIMDSFYMLNEQDKNIKEKISKSQISKKIYKEYENLPDYNNVNMNSEIANKIEYNTNIFKGVKDCNKIDFTLNPHQIFLKNFISNNSSYNSILLFHGTGTGKTCSAITIAENFKNTYEQDKIIILSPKNIIQNWKDTIFDETKNENQCTGNIYNDKIININNATNEKKNFIKKNYDIMGYRKFSNLIIYKLNLDLKLNTVSQFQIDIIKKNFNNRVIIIDEVHNIRDETDDKDIMKLLKIIVKYSNNVKLILLSATPMFNKSFEIINILNLMLLNDKRYSEIIFKQDIFDDNGLILDIPNKNGELPIDILNRITRGYISYSRGENIETFPLRLYPINTIEYPENDYKGNQLNDKKLKFLNLYGSTLDEITGNPPYKGNITQTKMYYNELIKIKNKNNLQIDDEIKFMQLSNIVYPFQKYFTGENGLKLTMSITTKSDSISYKYQNSVLKNFGPIFNSENIGKYSKKIENIIKIIKKSDGIVFIYSQYIKSGIIPIALALEHAGYSKLNSEPLLNYDKKNAPISYNGETLTPKNKSTFKRGNYIILSSLEKLSKNMVEELNISKSDNNTNGENIKIILGTSVASEGLDFKNIRMIHIMDPWHHMNRLEQVIGRGIRYCSHINLPIDKRNVMVFLHVLENFDKLNETTDINIYRNAENKAINIGKIENILKKNAIDCNIFNTNILENKKIKTLLPYYNNLNKIEQIEIDTKDKPYSKICSYSENCVYSCNNISGISKKNLDTLDIELFKPTLYIICKKIKELYNNRLTYNLNEIINLLNENGLECDIEVIYLSLNLMLNEKNENTHIINSNGISGYIEYKSDQYIFTPEEYNLKNIPYLYRNFNKIKKEEYIYIGPKKRNRGKQTISYVKNKQKNVVLEIDINIDKLKPYFDKTLNDKKFINNIDTKYLKFYILDRLSILEKQSYLNKIILDLNGNKPFSAPIKNNKINSKTNSAPNPKIYTDEDYVFEHFQRNFIYRGIDVGENSQYVFDKIIQNTIKPIGYRLFDGKSNIYYLLINYKIKKIEKEDELYDNIQSWLPIYKSTKEYTSFYINLIKNKTWGYIYTNSKKQYLFKIVEKGNENKPGFRAKGHKDCNGQQTGDFSQNILLELMEKTKYNNFVVMDKIIENKLFNTTISRSIRCIYLELIMRIFGLVYNYDIISMMNI